MRPLGTVLIPKLGHYPTVVFDEAVLAKQVHEVADAGAGGADHLGKRLLRDPGNERFDFAGLAKFRHQQQDAGEAFLAGVEELV